MEDIRRRVKLKESGAIKTENRVNNECRSYRIQGVRHGTGPLLVCPGLSRKQNYHSRVEASLSLIKSNI